MNDWVKWTIGFIVALLLLSFLCFVLNTFYLQNSSYFHEKNAGMGLEMFKAVDHFQRRVCKKVKNKRIALSFSSNADYLQTARRNCIKTVQQKGIDSCYIANMDYIDEKFKKQNENIFKERRGSGKWIWKSYIILKFLDENIENKDILFYIDGDFALLNPIDGVLCVQLKENQEISLFSQYEIERMWTKGDSFILMNLNSNEIERMASSIQTYAGFVVVRKTINSLRFIAEWQTYSQDERLILDKPNGLNLKPNYKGFRLPRNDQSIVSLLSKRGQILVWPNPLEAWGKARPQTENGTVYMPYKEIDATKFKLGWPLVTRYE